MTHAATIASDKTVPVTRMLAAELSPISAAIETVMEIEARLSAAIAEDRRAARAIVGRIQDNEQRRLALHALAAELEARLVKRPRRRNAA